MTRSVVRIVVDADSVVESTSQRAVLSSDRSVAASAKNVGQRPFDPDAARDMSPELWAMVLQQQYRGASAAERVAAHFGKSVRQAERWLAAKGGNPKLNDVRKAVRDDPRTALPILFDIAAE
ncbi:MAG: hypothetical protein AAF092_05230 [Pseudomonadota bacterium]